MATSESNWLALSAESECRSSVVGWVDAAYPPVFLHTGWRTGGTWLWSRFRTLPGVLGYYEPLHPDLATLDHARIDRREELHWTSGHPILHAPYFEEFRPLMNDGMAGVHRFQPCFATENFFAPAYAELSELSDYLRGLLQSAEVRGRQPVLKFCRSLGRLGWMQQSFPQAVHIVVLRNPLAQFATARLQFINCNNAFFQTMPCLLLAAQQDYAPVASALHDLKVKLPRIWPGADRENKFRAYQAALAGVSTEQLYRMFLAFWMLTAVGVPPTIDMIINYDMLTLSPRYRGECELDLQKLTGLSADLSDASREGDDRLLDRVGLSRSQLRRCHRDAEAILAGHGATDWCDEPRLACAGALLEYATLLAMDGSAALQATAFGQMANWDALTAMAATATGCISRAVQAERRAEQAERQLAAVYASTSWAVTAPLRRLREMLPI
jgi:hypothetical protein